MNLSYTGTSRVLDHVVTSNLSSYMASDQRLYKQVYSLLYGYVLPVICICGFLGNVLNLMILTGSRVQRSLHRMEKSSNTSLIALAVADLCFCFCAFPSSFLPQDNVYTSPGFMIRYGQFCAAIINMFIMTSTWLTVTMSSERFIAICYPLRSRRIISLQRTKIANICVYAFSVIINIPVLWRYTVERKVTDSVETYHLNQRILFGSEQIDHVYRGLWAILGNIIPLVLLIVFNIRLTREIHKSYAMRRNMNEHTTQDSTRRSRDQETSNRITLTLVTIVAMFFVLVAPSEMLKHMVYLFDGSLADNFSYLTIEIVTNVMQSINFSANFMLYCILNPSFRRSIKSMLFRTTSSAECHFAGQGHASGHMFDRSRPPSGYSLQMVTLRSNSLRTPRHLNTALTTTYCKTHLNRHAHSMKTPSPRHACKNNGHFV